MVHRVAGVRNNLETKLPLLEITLSFLTYYISGQNLRVRFLILNYLRCVVLEEVHKY